MSTKSTAIAASTVRACRAGADAARTTGTVTAAQSDAAGVVLRKLRSAAVMAATNDSADAPAPDMVALAMTPAGRVMSRAKVAGKPVSPLRTYVGVSWRVLSRLHGRPLPAGSDVGVGVGIDPDDANVVAVNAGTGTTGDHVVAPGSALALPVVVVPAAARALASDALVVQYAAWVQAGA